MALLVAAPSTSGADAWDLLSADVFDWRDGELRAAVAADLKDRVLTLANVVPPLNPADRARLMARRDDLAPGDAKARSRLYLSIDYQHWVLLERLDDILEPLNCVLATEVLDAEMVCWARAGLAFSHDDKIDVALGRLREARVVLRDDKMPVRARAPSVWYREYSRGIQGRIVLPYLTMLAEQGSP